ncbi:MAG: glycosyltransferase, partial [Pseudomonadota bacterium]
MCVYVGDDAELFERALRSVLDQTYADGPIRIYLCVDGPVPDAIESVLAHHRDQLRCVVRNEIGQGLAKSLNRLIGQLADEAFVFRMDSDDYAVPERFALQATHLRAHPEIDILGGGIAEVEKSGDVIREVRYPAEAARIRTLIAARNPVAHPTVCFRRAAISVFEAYPETAINQDWALWFEVLQLGLSISNLDRILV